MAETKPIIEHLTPARTRCTFILSDTERSLLEKQAITLLGKNLTLKGFRPGQAPPDVVREHCGKERITEELVHLFLRQTLPSLLQAQHLTPIIHPRVELTSHAPITLRITIVEKPPIKLRKKETLRIAKKEIAVTEDDVKKTLDTLKKEHAISEWTEAVVQKTWGIPSLEKLRTSITDALKRQREQAEQKRREEAFFEQIQNIVEVDLAPELLEDEEQQMLKSLQENLRKQNLSFTEWLKRTGKAEDAFRTDLRSQAERRLRLRFGIDALLQEHTVSVSEEEMAKEIGEFLRSLPKEERTRLAPLYTRGGEGYERFRWQRRMQKLLAVFLE